MVGFLRRPIEMAVLGVIVALVVLTPIFGSRLVVYNLTIVAIYSIVVMALNLLLGLAGQVSFAQTSFMAGGGYGSALLTTKLGWTRSSLLSLRLPSLRRRGRSSGYQCSGCAATTSRWQPSRWPSAHSRSWVLRPG